MPHLSATPAPIATETSSALGIPSPDLLHAMRVDPRIAFAHLVEEQVTDAALRARIFSNSLYRHVTTDLTGSQEYAATLSLFELRRDGAYDLIILDTPPTANALEFLETPKRLAAAIGSPALQWFARPDPSTSRFSLKRLGLGGAMIIRRAGKLMGSQFLDDLGEFLLDIQLGLLLSGEQASSETLDVAATKLAALAGYLTQIAHAQKSELGRLASASPGVEITAVPLMPHDVSSIDSLRAIADRLESA